MLKGLRLIVRQLWYTPGYSVMVVLTLALAIGANSAVFSAVNAVLMRPLPVVDPDRAVVVWQTDNAHRAGGHRADGAASREWTADQSVFIRAAIMGSHNWGAVLEDGRGEPTRVEFNGVSAGFFETLGVTPLLGRTFRPEDDTPTSAPVLVLSHSSWVRRFASDPQIVGKTMNLDGQPVEVIGVMPEGFDVPRGAEFWAPAMPVLRRWRLIERHGARQRDQQRRRVLSRGPGAARCWRGGDRAAGGRARSRGCSATCPVGRSGATARWSCRYSTMCLVPSVPRCGRSGPRSRCCC